MAQAQKKAASPTKAKANLRVVKGGPVRLSPQMVTKATRGAELAKIVADATRELETLKTTFETWFIANGTREGVNAQGRVLATRTHGEPNTFDLKEFRTVHPKIAEEFTWPHPWDSVAFAK